MSRLTDFYQGTQTASCGESFDYIVNTANDEWLERAHNYIQWLFPVPEPSQAVPGSPVLTGDDCAVFRLDVQMRIRAFSALERMLRFYRDNCTGPLRWLRPRNHNFLRITRIIRFLTVIGEPGLATFFEQTMVILGGGQIDDDTLWFWAEALKPQPAWL